MMLPAFYGDATSRLRVAFGIGYFEITQNEVKIQQDSQSIDNEYVRSENGFPARVIRLVVKSGVVDSVSGSPSGRISLGANISNSETGLEATFAGDQLRGGDFYRERIAAIASEQVADRRPVQIVDRSIFAGRTIVTILVSPFEQGDNSQTYFHAEIELSVFGSADLDYEIVQSSDLNSVVELAPRQRRGISGPALASSAMGADYLAVTASEFVEELEPLLLWKQQTGLTTSLFTIDQIVASNEGSDDAAKLRNFLIANYELGARYVLLAGDETILPIRYAYHANTSTIPSIELQNICDLYFADVDGNWDADGDGVFGEPAQDQPDLYGELLVGRLPFHREQDFAAYVEKLIAYEQNPGSGDYEYLNKSLFIAADQMRDYQGVGQQQLLSESFPEYVLNEMSAIVEAPSGDAVNPEYPEAPEAIGKMGEGWGFTTLLIHGVSDGWVLRSNQYNQWPKSFLFTGSGSDGAHGFLPNIPANGKPGLIYSIGCDNAAFDMDAPPFPASNPCVAEMFLAKPDGGAVAFVGYSRWGWVATSWKLADAFIEYLYNSSTSPAEALRHSKAAYPSYRDLCYGLNYLGDPALKYWRVAPQASSLFVPSITASGPHELLLAFKSGDNAIIDATVTLTQNGDIIAQSQTDGLGLAVLAFEFNVSDEFAITVYREGYVAQTKALSPEIVLDADDDTDHALPGEFRLHQNFPNPFNPTTTISFDCPHSTRVTLTIVNLLGQVVTILTDTEVQRGRNDFAWDGRDASGVSVSSGVYFAVARAEDFAAAIKMSLLK